MADLDLLRSRRRDAVIAAAKRWSDRQAVRLADNSALVVGGPGAADSAMRQARFSARTAVLRQAAEMRLRGQLPVFVERKIGPTLDFLSGAPSEAARKAGRPVARIVNTVNPNVQAQGFATGFMISPRLLLTNAHVFPDKASAFSTGANFLHEFDEQGLKLGLTFEIDPETFFVSHEALDFAIVGVKPKAVTGESLDDLSFITPSEATSKILKGQPIEIIQYPDGGGKQYATQNNRLIDILDEGFLHYQTDTLEGSSGSPAYSESWEIVALHHAGIPEVRNGRIVATDGSDWTEDMGDERVRWVANEGVRISAIIRALSTMKLADPAQSRLLSDLLSTTTDPADDVSRILAEEQPTQAGGSIVVATEARTTAPMEREFAMAGTVMNFAGPVTIHVYAPAPSPAPGDVAQTVGPVAVEKTLRFDPNYDDREGYNPAFLGDGLLVPLPSVTEERKNEMLMEPGGDILVLRYHHYSLAMNAKRKMQIWSAVNVDYDANLRQQSGRAFFGTDRWIADPRIPARLQIEDADVYSPAHQIDRGHIVRREDNAWGQTPEETEFANSDTFHWTNCTPQHQAFNRETPGSRYGGVKGLWGAFEAYVQKSLLSGDTKACILAGPVLADDDPSEDFGTGEIQYPIRFWKVVVVADRSEGNVLLRAYGFVLSQDDVVKQFGVEFTPGQYARYQRPLTEIAGITGVVFDASIMAADTAATVA